MKEIESTKAFQLLAKDQVQILDVRSETEFLEGNFKNSINLPILNDDHRKLVGIDYKHNGVNSAKDLGHKLVSGEFKENLIQSWISNLALDKINLITCWRGGLRSKISQTWLNDKNHTVIRVINGYKGLRKIAINEIFKKRNFIIISGYTGSNKTGLIKQIKNSIDLENLANHRGSAFGAIGEQPKQASFENKLALELYFKNDHIFLEDESRSIGNCYLTNELYQQMAIAPMYLLESSLEDRIRNIFTNYVVSNQPDLIFYSLSKIRKKLGNQLFDQLSKMVKNAYLNNDQEQHLEWIKSLLTNYYDKLYKYSLSLKSRAILGQGDFNYLLDKIKTRENY